MATFVVSLFLSSGALGLPGGAAPAGAVVAAASSVKSACQQMLKDDYFADTSKCPRMVGTLSRAATISKAQLKKLKEGMSYAQVVKLVGPAQFQSYFSSAVDEADFSYRGPGKGLSTRLSFTNDRLDTAETG